jgi:hypothetical protein
MKGTRMVRVGPLLVVAVSPTSFFPRCEALAGTVVE